MSHSSHSHSQDRSADHAARHGRHRAHSAAAVSQHVSRAHAAVGDYTLVHGGRQVRIGPVAFWIVVGTLVIMAVWSIGTGTYFAFRQDVLSGLISRHARMQIAYEDRIAALRGEVDRITSRQLLDQEQFERRLDALLKRQTTAGAAHQRARRRRPHHRLDAARQARQGRAAQARRRLRPSLYRRVGRKRSAGLGGKLARVSHSLDRVAQRADARCSTAWSSVSTAGPAACTACSATSASSRAARRRKAARSFRSSRRTRDASAFDKKLYRVSLARAKIAQYTAHAAHGAGAQAAAAATSTSPPPSARAAIRSSARRRFIPASTCAARSASTVHATADGKVERAGWDGGYGNLVEIDNGHGIVTRFGHLSKILVKAGQQVHRGQVVGLMGSTGRSTGPHLHYEVRVDGKAVDPEKFLRAGIRLGSL